MKDVRRQQQLPTLNRGPGQLVQALPTETVSSSTQSTKLHSELYLDKYLKTVLAGRI